MKQINVNDKPLPEDMSEMRKTATVFFQWVDEPHTIRTMEGTTHVIDESIEHWENGYWVAWPSDGTDPYPVAPKFVRDNYEPVQP